MYFLLYSFLLLFYSILFYKYYFFVINSNELYWRVAGAVICVYSFSEIILFWLCYIMELLYEQEEHVRKSLVICATQLAGGLLLKKLKYFEVMWNIFEFSRVWKYVETWLVYANKLFWIAQPYFMTDTIKRS